MDIRRWRDALDAITQPSGWIARRDGKAERAYEVLAGYDQPNGWIGYSFAAEHGTTKPDEAYYAELKRDAILQLAVLHELRQDDIPRQDHERDAVSDLQRAVVQVAMSSDMGLRPKAVARQEPKLYSERDFAHTKHARKFFEETVRPRLLRIDAATGVGLSDRVPLRYEPDDEDSILHWGRVWTAGAALVLLDWVRSKDCRSTRHIARALWCGTDPAGNALRNFHPSTALIPTSRQLVLNVRVEFRTRAAIAYALAGSETIRALNPEQPWSVPLALSEISDAKYVGSKKVYRGYNRMHLYLAILSDCMCGANGTPAMAEPDPNEPDALSAEQQAALAQMTAAREHLAAMRKAMAGARRLSSIRKAAPSTGSIGQGAGTTFDWEPLSQGSLRLLLADETPGARWQPIATIELWRGLGSDVDWIDLLVVARIGDQRVRLPMTMDDEATDDDAGARSLLVLDEGANPALSASALRSALERTDAVVGVVIRKGLGAFVVLEIDMNGQQPSTDSA